MAEGLTISRGDILFIPQDAVGNTKSLRLRVDRIEKIEVRRRGRYTLVYGVEVTKAGQPRVYFGRRYSEFRIWLGEDDYQVIGP